LRPERRKRTTEMQWGLGGAYSKNGHLILRGETLAQSSFATPGNCREANQREYLTDKNRKKSASGWLEDAKGRQGFVRRSGLRFAAKRTGTNERGEKGMDQAERKKLEEALREDVVR